MMMRRGDVYYTLENPTNDCMVWRSKRNGRLSLQLGRSPGTARCSEGMLEYMASDWGKLCRRGDDCHIGTVQGASYMA